MPFKLSLFDTEFDCVGSGLMSLDYIRYQLNLANGQDVEVDISSGGGDAFDAVAIYDLLKKYGNVNTNNISLAGSAASTIFAAGKKRTMSKYALLMIHPAQAKTQGDSNELIADAAMLSKLTENIIAIWVDVTGQSIEKITELVNATTWMTADEALALGFITDIEDYNDAEASMISNATVVLNQVSIAPAKYKQVINKILIKKPEPAATDNAMTKEEKQELLDKNESFIKKVLNFFKPSLKKVVTNKGDKYVLNTIAEGSPVFNDADMDKAAEDDDDMEATDTDGNKVKMSVKNGKVTKVENKKPDAATTDDDDDTDDDTDPDNKIVLNAHNIVVTNKIDRKVVINSIAGKLKEVTNRANTQDALIIDLRNQLVTANSHIALTDKEIRNQILSDFIPKNSARVDKTPVGGAAATGHIIEPTTPLAKNAAKLALDKAGIKE